LMPCECQKTRRSSSKQELHAAFIHACSKTMRLSRRYKSLLTVILHAQAHHRSMSAYRSAYPCCQPKTTSATKRFAPTESAEQSRLNIVQRQNALMPDRRELLLCSRCSGRRANMVARVKCARRPLLPPRPVHSSVLWRREGGFRYTIWLVRRTLYDLYEPRRSGVAARAVTGRAKFPSLTILLGSLRQASDIMSIKIPDYA